MNHPQPSPSRGSPPSNRAQFWFRVVLWILPAGITATSWLGLNKLSSLFAGFADWIIPLWLVLNLTFVLGAGWFNALLSGKAHSREDGIPTRILLFFIMQVFVSPLLLLALLAVYVCLKRLIHL